jgi:hypothetical protein
MRETKTEKILHIFPFLRKIVTSAKVFERIERYFIEEIYYRHQKVVVEG